MNGKEDFLLVFYMAAEGKYGQGGELELTPRPILEIGCIAATEASDLFFIQKSTMFSGYLWLPS